MSCELDLPENLVRLVAQLQIEPAEFAVVSSDDEMVAKRVDVHRRYPLDPWLQRLEQLLLRKVVNPHIALGLWRDEMNGLDKGATPRALTATKKCGFVG